MTAETDLLPCPWCGEKLANVSVSEGSTFRWRKVDGCCADGPEVRHDTMADDQVAAEVESRAAAIAAWNRRAQSAEIEALRAEVDEWKDAARCASEQQDSLFREARALNERADNLRAEVERANSWNERVSVCRDHVADIVDGPCVICALDAAKARADKLAEALRDAADDIDAGVSPEDAAAHLRARADLLRDQEEGHEQ